MMTVGLIGAGVIADLHAQAVNATDTLSLVAVMDTDRTRADALAQRHNVVPFSSLDTFLAESGAQIVSICTPSGLHRDAAVAAASAGKHIVVEKPIEVTVKRAEEILSACNAAGISLTGVFQTRFHPAAQKLYTVIDQGRFGRISLVSAEVKWYRDQRYYDAGGWRGTWALDGGGALMNQSIHVINLLRWYFGFPVEISAHAALRTHVGLEVEDSLVASLVFPSGVLGTIQATTGAWPGSFKTIEVCGEAGHVRLEENRFTRWEFSDTSESLDAVNESVEGDSDVVDPNRIGCAAHRAQYEDFVAAINGEREPMVTAVDAVEAVRLVSEIYRVAGIGPDRPLR